MKNLTNRIQLVGYVGQDPEVKDLPGGKKVARFSLAYSESYKNDKGDKISNTHWFNVVGWNGMASLVEKFLHKGSYITLDGKLITRNYVDKLGNKRRHVEIQMNEMLMLPNRKKAS